MTQRAGVTSPLGYEFEKLAADVLSDQGYRVKVQPYDGPIQALQDFDILAFGKHGVQIPVEVKYTRRQRVSIAMLRDASSKAARWKPHAIKARPMLVYGAAIEKSLREWAELEFGIEIWDRDILFSKAEDSLPKLDRFFQQNPAIWDSSEHSDQTARREAIEEHPDQLLRPKGEELVAKLRDVPSGKKGAKAYEEVCRAIIDYIFVDDLRDVRSQRRTVDGLNFYDLIYRVRPSHPFWTTLTRDFRARVVLFECKNYGKPIGPMQVFSTERYLSASALRPVCFVLSRKPANDRAMQAAYGAMRESGKLLVFLSDEDLEAMLRAKDFQLNEGGSQDEREANDPIEILDQKIYDFISAMPR